MNDSRWIIHDTGISSAKENMEIDTRLLDHLDPSSHHPILHLYDWEGPSATYGHFLDPSTHLSQQALHSGDLQLAKRPTGGGLIFHTTDWAFSILIPAGHEAYSVNILENYAFVNKLVIEIISCFLGSPTTLSLLPNEPPSLGQHSKHFCMAKPTKYDVMLDGKKVGGGAQRRTKSGFLHQGSIALTLPDPTFLQDMLLPGTEVYQAMLDNTFTLLKGKVSSKVLLEARRTLGEIFKARVFP